MKLETQIIKGPGQQRSNLPEKSIKKFHPNPPERLQPQEESLYCQPKRNTNSKQAVSYIIDYNNLKY
jgi:hypothetical protein